MVNETFRKLAKVTSLPLSAGAVNVNMGLLLVNSTDLLSHLDLPIKLSSAVSVVCVEGEVKLSVDLEEHKLTPSSMMVLGPGQTLQSVTTSSDFKGFSIVASMRTLSGSIPYMSRVVMCFLHSNETPVIKLTSEELTTQILLHDLLQRIMLRKDRPDDNDLILRHLGETILYETIGVYSHYIVNAPSASRRRSDELYYKFLQLVELHFKKERSVSFYADSIAVTSKHLSSVVKECSGRTAGEWIDLYVILEAKMLLSASDMSIKEISAELSFPNQSFFGKYFKHHTGQSPRQFRNENSI